MLAISRPKGPNMRRDLPTRFWVEAILAGLGLVLFVVTLFSREWFELLTGLDPDGGNGSLEIVLAAIPLAIATASALLARRDYRRGSAPA
jgi:hypothetical protein